MKISIVLFRVRVSDRALVDAKQSVAEQLESFSITRILRARLFFENFEQADDVFRATPWAGRVLGVLFFVFPV